MFHAEALLGGLEGVVEGDNERMGDVLQDISLCFGVLHLVTVQNVLLA